MTGDERRVFLGSLLSLKRQKKAEKLIKKKATVRNSTSYTVFFINRTMTDAPTALDCLKQMTKVIKSYGGSSLPTGHKP